MVDTSSKKQKTAFDYWWIRLEVYTNLNTDTLMEKISVLNKGERALVRAHAGMALMSEAHRTHTIDAEDLTAIEQDRERLPEAWLRF